MRPFFILREPNLFQVNGWVILSNISFGRPNKIRLFQIPVAQDFRAFANLFLRHGVGSDLAIDPPNAAQQQVL